MKEEVEGEKTPINYKIEESKRALVFRLPQEYAGRSVEIYVDGHFLLTYTIGKKAELQINKKSKLGQEILNDLNKGRNVEVKV